ncbi:uncharacterized protein LOC119457104 [Dermacentor silvarum]|uniref:uncharacterized protein LOC119457104 n=1 Tax=Dermacentor silvarum TaxID=543639 RepID=UPI0018988110|nr:uncharacterized protein LOC119457104 [Dermacentor silvarum]
MRALLLQLLLAVTTSASATLHCHLLKGGPAGRPFLGGGPGPLVGAPGGFKGSFGGGYSGFRGDFHSGGGGFAPAGPLFASGPGGFGVGPAVGGGFGPSLAFAPGPTSVSGFGPGAALPAPLTLSRPPAVQSTFIPGGQTKVILVKVKHLGTTTHHPTGFNGPAQGGPLQGPTFGAGPFAAPFGLPSSAGFGGPLKSGKGGWW